MAEKSDDTGETKDDKEKDSDKAKKKQWIQRFGKSYEPYFEDAAAEGTYPVKLTNIAIYGAAGCGKTGLVGLFLNKLPLFPDEEIVGSLPHDDGVGEDDKGYGSESDNQDPCTEIRVEVMENKEEVNEYRFCYRRVDPKYVWKLYDIDSLYLMLSERISNHLTNPPPDPLSLYSAFSKKEPKKKFPPPPPPPKLILPDDSMENAIEVSARTVLSLLPIQGSLDDIEKTHWIYVADCGSETLFLDIAPSLMRFFCVNLCCYRAIDELDQQVQFNYVVDGKPIVGRSYRPITIRQLMNLMFGGKIETLHPRAIGVVSTEFARNPYYSVIATHYDLYQALEKENNAKELISVKNECFHQDLKTYAHVRIDNHSIHGQVSFPFNTAARQKKDLKTVERFKRIANHCFMELKFPIRWYLFFIQINQIKGSSRVIISLNECIQMAALVGIHSVDVVKAALEYFHDLMLILYFPSVIPQVVFLSQKRIFDKLSEVMAVFLDVHTSTFNPFHVALLKRGILDRALLDSLPHGFAPHFFSPDDFLRLLEHLHIIKSLENSRYYLPFLLNEMHEPHKQLKNDRIDPLLFVWKKATIPVPTGLFLTLVHYLWRLESFEFALSSSNIAASYRNKIEFDCPAIEGKVILFQTEQFLGVTHTAHLKHSRQVRQLIVNGIEGVCDLLRWHQNHKKPKEGFLCDLRDACREDPIPHVCVVNDAVEFIKCKEEPPPAQRAVIKDLTQAHWYKPIDELIEQRTRLHEKPPQWQEMYQFMVHRAEEWLDVGYRLDVNRPWLQQLRETWRLTSEQKLAVIMKKWVETKCSPVTWDFLILLLKDFSDHKEAAGVNEWLEQERLKYEKT